MLTPPRAGRAPRCGICCCQARVPSPAPPERSHRSPPTSSGSWPPPRLLRRCQSIRCGSGCSMTTPRPLRTASSDCSPPRPMRAPWGSSDPSRWAGTTPSCSWRSGCEPRPRPDALTTSSLERSTRASTMTAATSWPWEPPGPSSTGPCGRRSAASPRGSALSATAWSSRVPRAWPDIASSSNPPPLSATGGPPTRGFAVQHRSRTPPTHSPAPMPRPSRSRFPSPIRKGPSGLGAAPSSPTGRPSPPGPSACC